MKRDPAKNRRVHGGVNQPASQTPELCAGESF